MRNVRVVNRVLNVNNDTIMTFNERYECVRQNADGHLKIAIRRPRARTFDCTAVIVTATVMISLLFRKATGMFAARDVLGPSAVQRVDVRLVRAYRPPPSHNIRSRVFTIIISGYRLRVDRWPAEMCTRSFCVRESHILYFKNF